MKSISLWISGWYEDGVCGRRTLVERNKRLSSPSTGGKLYRSRYKKR